MLEKTPLSDSAKPSLRKRTRVGSSAAATEIINEPKPDWVLPWEAPFYCFSGRYLRSAQEWADALQIEIQAFTKSYCDGPPEPIGEWSVIYAKKEAGACIKAMGIKMEIAPTRVLAMFRYKTSEFNFQGLAITGPRSAFNEKAWQWLRSLRLYLLKSWKRSFLQAIMFGTAHIMARKHTVLAPFERVTFTQWQYFRVDEGVLGPANKDVQWGDPRFPYLAGRLPSATGPAGEKLFDIHIAPGTDATSVDPEQACVEWMIALLREYPDRPPEPLGSYAKEAMLKFPGLTKRGFDRCYLLARMETGNQNWSRSGPRRPRQKSPHHK
jgi:hypothetical protein